MRFIIIFLSFLLLNCGDATLPTNYQVLISSDFNTQEITYIENGIAIWSGFPEHPNFKFDIVAVNLLPAEKEVAWNQIVIRQMPLKEIITETSQFVIAYTDTTSELNHLEHTDNNDLQVRLYNEVGATIYFPPYSDIEDKPVYQEAAAHETGHAMGLRHTGINSIMYITFSGWSGKLSCEDIQQFCMIRNETCECNE